jgi:hypothetical protein
MAAQYDGVNLLVTLDAPVAEVLNQTAEQVYDDGKIWHLNVNNRKYSFPWLTSGGEDITPTSIAGQYYFFRNDLGWRIWTTDEDQDVYWDGNLIPADLSLPIFARRTGRTVAHLGLQPITQGIVGLEDRTVQTLMDYIVEAGFTYLQVYRILAAHAAGRINEPVDGTYAIRDLNNTKDRIVGTESVNGGRIITTVDGS